MFRFMNEISSVLPTQTPRLGLLRTNITNPASTAEQENKSECYMSDIRSALRPRSGAWPSDRCLLFTSLSCRLHTLLNA